MGHYTFFSIPLLIILFIQILPFTHGTGFYAPSGGYIHQMNASNTTVSKINVTDNNTTNNTVHNATAAQIENAKIFLSDFLGGSYYDKYVNYTYSIALNKTAEVYFSYEVPFKNGSVTKTIYGVFTPLERILGIAVEVSGKNNSVIGYNGPAKPYVINITENEAINSTLKYGFSNNTADIEGVYPIINNTTNSTNYSKYYIVWAIKDGIPFYPNNTPTTEYYSRLYKGVYIDSSNGSILGEFVYNPSIVTPLTHNGGIGYSGSFNLFNLSKINQTKSNQTYVYNSTTSIHFTPNFKLIVIILFVAALIVMMAYVIFRYLMHGV